MDEIPWYDGLDVEARDVVVTDIRSTHARLPREPETIGLAEIIETWLDDIDHTP